MPGRPGSWRGGLAAGPVAEGIARREAAGAAGWLAHGGTLTPALEEIAILDLAHHAGGDAHRHAAGGHVARHDGGRRHERLLADLDAGAEDRAAAHPARAPQRRAVERLAGSVPRHRRVVRRRPPRADEALVLYDRARVEVDVRLHPHPRRDADVVVD